MDWDRGLAGERFERRDERIWRVGVLCLKGLTRRSIFSGSGVLLRVSSYQIFGFQELERSGGRVLRLGFGLR